MDIADYFKVNVLKVETKDWDSVEEVIKKVIKSPAANPDFKPQQQINEVSM